MAEEPNERTEGEGAAAPPLRRRTLTPEQRRFMGTPRLKDEPEKKELRETRTEEPVAPSVPEAIAPREEKPPDDAPARRKGRTTVAKLKPGVRLSPGPDHNWSLLGLGAVILLGLAFYGGMKFPALMRQIYAGRQAPALESSIQQKYVGLSANELVTQALAAERAGNFQEATDKLSRGQAKGPDLSRHPFSRRKNCL